MTLGSAAAAQTPPAASGREEPRRAAPSSALFGPIDPASYNFDQNPTGFFVCNQPRTAPVCGEFAGPAAILGFGPPNLNQQSRTVIRSGNPSAQSDALWGALGLHNQAEARSLGGSTGTGFATLFGRQPRVPGNGFNSDFGGYNGASLDPFPRFDGAATLVNLALGFNGATSPINFSSFLMGLGGLFDPLSTASGFGFIGAFGLTGFSSMSGGPRIDAGLGADGAAAADLVGRYEALGRKQVAAYYTDPALIELRIELNAVVYAIAYLDPVSMYSSEELGKLTREMYSTRPSYAAALRLRQEVAGWRNPPDDTALLRTRYDTRIRLLRITAQVQQEALQYLKANPEIAARIGALLAIVEQRYAAAARDLAPQFADWQARFDQALAASPAFQAYLRDLSQFLADYPELAEYRRLEGELKAMLPALASQPTVKQLAEFAEAITRNPDVVAQVTSLHDQYVDVVNRTLSQTAFAPEQERHYEALAGLIAADPVHAGLEAIQSAVLRVLAGYRSAVHDAVQRCANALAGECDPYADPGVRALLVNDATFEMLAAVGAFYEADNLFWYVFYIGRAYTDLEGRTRQRLSAAVQPVASALLQAAQEYTAAVDAIPAVRQLLQLQKNSIAALRIFSPAFNSRLTRMEQIIQLLAYGGPLMALDRTALRFAAVTDGASFVSQTSPQVIRLTQHAPGAVTWTAASNQPWLSVSPSSGTGPAMLTIRVVAVPGLPIGETLTGAIALTFSGTGSTVDPIAVALTTLARGTSTGPFGTVDTPANDSTGVTGAVPFTGWVLDDVEVAGVTVCRAPVAREAAPLDARCGGAPQIFIGDAVFIDGARPDVETAFPVYARSHRAGWGLMVLTNMLPDVARGLPTGGVGTFVFHMYARDREGLVTPLGTRTITCANDRATSPFGTIDRPVQGEVISGPQYVNFGWALTPNPNFVPVDGSTITIYLDGVPAGTVSYDHFRPDIAGYFPGLANSKGAVGFRVIDTTALANGVHTIAWTVTDNTGTTAGIGSRFFTVSNAVAAPAGAALRPGDRPSAASTAEPGVMPNAAIRTSTADEVDALPLDRAPIAARRGWDLERAWTEYSAGTSEGAIVRGEELDRFELQLRGTGGDRYSGYLRVGRHLAPLPLGSRLDAAAGRFIWTPVAGFVGGYDLVFVRISDGRAIARQEVRIVLAPRGSGRLGPQVVIDAPRAAEPQDGPFLIAGWAADLDAQAGTGVDAVHIWAYPVAGTSPIFLGAADLGGSRPDVAAVHGQQFSHSGYGLVAQGLPAGEYDLAVFAWSTSIGQFLPARLVRVAIR